MTDIELAVCIAEKVNALGGNVYFVGGYVRDTLLNLPNKDIDIEVFGITSTQLKDILSSIGEITEYGKSFGILSLKGFHLDISMPRKERATGNKHTDFEVTVDPFMSTYEAAKRRDLTINAIMQNVLTAEYVDHFGGLNDIKNKIIRHVDNITFVEDPLRVLRIAQFYSRLPEFTVAEETMEICKTIDLSTLSKERVFEELSKALLKGESSRFFEFLRDINQLDMWFPEVKQLIGVKQHKYYHAEGDVYNHTMLVLDNICREYRHGIRITSFVQSNILPLCLSALCHDFGKIVATNEGKDGNVHAYNHELYGAATAEKFLTRLTNDKHIINYVLNMVKMHMLPHQMFNHNSRAKKTNHMFFDSVDPKGLIELAFADTEGSIVHTDFIREEDTNRAYDENDWLLNRYERFEKLMRKPYVTGDDLIAEGYKPSKEFSNIFKLVHKLRMAEVSKEDAIRQINGEFGYLRKTS